MINAFLHYLTIKRAVYISLFIIVMVLQTKKAVINKSLLHYVPFNSLKLRLLNGCRFSDF